MDSVVHDIMFLAIAFVLAHVTLYTDLFNNISVLKCLKFWQVLHSYGKQTVILTVRQTVILMIIK